MTTEFCVTAEFCVATEIYVTAEFYVTILTIFHPVVCGILCGVAPTPVP